MARAPKIVDYIARSLGFGEAEFPIPSVSHASFLSASFFPLDFFFESTHKSFHHRQKSVKTIFIIL